MPYPPFFSLVWFVCLFRLVLFWLVALALSCPPGSPVVVISSSGFGLLWTFSPISAPPRSFSFLAGAQRPGLFASGVSTSPALLAVSTFLSPVCLFFLLRCLSSWVWCLVFLAVDWSRISSIILSFIFPCLLVRLAQHLPSGFIIIKYHFPRKDSSVIFLAVDWSGVSPRWPPNQSLFSTVSGRRLDQGLCHLAIVWIS